jgi:hypothetical protein
VHRHASFSAFSLLFVLFGSGEPLSSVFCSHQETNEIPPSSSAKSHPLFQVLLGDMQAAARKLGLQLHVLNASNERDFDRIFEALVQLRAGALVIGADAFLTSHSDLCVIALRCNDLRLSGQSGLSSAGSLNSCLSVGVTNFDRD